jgi:hypothetical protein
MGKDATVWMRALKDHTYHGRPQAEGDCYLAVSDDVENIENIRFAVRVPSPPPAQNRSPVPPPDQAAVGYIKFQATVPVTSPAEPLTMHSTAPVTTIAERQRRQRRKA